MKRYVVVRVGKSITQCVTRPTEARNSSLEKLVDLQATRPETDYRIAELTIPTVAPYSDYWTLDDLARANQSSVSSL